MFNICVVGHGNYPDGMVSALKLLAGTDENIMKFNLNQELTHAQYEEQLSHYLTENDNVIVFADMTGGAPHQIASRLILEKGKGTQYIISSAPLNLMLDILMKVKMELLSVATISADLQHSLAEAKEMMLLLPEGPVIEQAEDCFCEEEGI